MIVKVYDGLKLWKDNPKDCYNKMQQVHKDEENLPLLIKNKVILKQVGDFYPLV